MLTISRADVDGEEITEFPVETRFIKLPIQNYLKLLTAYDIKSGTYLPVSETIVKPQIALINAVNNPKYRFICAALSRRLGKTYMANIIGQLVSLVPNCNVLIMSPNYSLSSISFELQRKLVKHFDIEVQKDNLKERILELENGSTVRMGSVGQVDSCVGRSYNLIIFDEAALSSLGEAAFNVALRPTLDLPNSKAIFISTPRGKNNWFTRFYLRGFSKDFPGWCSIHADYLENPRMKQSDVDEAREILSKAEFEQEYMASFVTYEGQIYKFDQSNIVTELPEGDYEVIAGLDPGYKDPTAMIILRYYYAEDCFYIVDEYEAAEANTQAHAEKIQELLTKHDISAIFIDSAAAQFAADLAYIYDIATIKAKKDVLPGISYTQTLVETSRLKVLSECVGTLEMLDSYQWDTKEGLNKERPLHNKASHKADALRYALYTYTL